MDWFISSNSYMASCGLVPKKFFSFGSAPLFNRARTISTVNKLKMSWEWHSRSCEKCHTTQCSHAPDQWGNFYAPFWISAAWKRAVFPDRWSRRFTKASRSIRSRAPSVQLDTQQIIKGVKPGKPPKTQFKRQVYDWLPMTQTRFFSTGAALIKPLNLVTIFFY